MIVDSDTAPDKTPVQRITSLGGSLWRGLLAFGFLAIGLVIAIVGLQIPIVALVIAVLLLMGAVGRATVLSRGKPLALYALLSVIVFLALAAASLFWTPDYDAAEHQLIQFAYTLVPLALALGVVSRLPADQTKLLQWAMIAGVIIGLGILVFEVREGKLIHIWMADLEPGETLSINEFNRALVGMAIILFPAVGLMLARGQDNLAVVMPVAYGALLTQTESQTALLGVGAGIIAYVLVTRVPKLTIGLMAAALLILSLGALPLAYGLKMAGLSDFEWLMLSARHRVEVWHFAAEQILTRPWFGHGLEAAQASFPRAGDISSFLPPDIAMVHRHPHNLFLQFWYEFGLVGAVFLLVSGYLMLWRLWQLPKRARDAGVATLAACVAMLSVSAFSIWHTWLLCTLALALYAIFLLAGTTTATMILPTDKRDRNDLAMPPPVDQALTDKRHSDDGPKNV